MTLSLVAILVSCTAGGAENAEPAFRSESAFVPSEDGFVITAEGDGRLAPIAPCEPGAYLLVGEYKTEGMAPLAMFAVDAKDASGKVAMSNYDWTCPSPNWAPFFLAVQVPEAGKVYLRVGNWKKCKGAESKLHLRGLKLVKQEWTEGMDLLANGDQGKSTPGYIPPMWFHKLAGDRSKGWPADGAAVVKETSGNVLRMSSPGNGAAVMLNSHCFNLPPKGFLELTFRAKADKPCVIKPRIVQSWGGGQYNNTRIAVGTDWTTVSMNLRVTPTTKRKFFFLRLDMPIDEKVVVDFADLKLLWRENHKGVNGPLAKKKPSAKRKPTKKLPPFDPKNLPSVAKSPREYLVGLNIAGGEFASTGQRADFGFPSNETLDYFAKCGFKLIRLPFKWERIQPVLGKDLDPAYSAVLVRTIQEIGKRGMVVIPDLHNYARYKGKLPSDGGYTYEQYHDTWDRLATLLAPHRKYIWAYGLMNEPHIRGAAKVPYWQGAIDAIRKHDPTTQIAVSGEGIRVWPENPPQFHLKDPARALVFEKHFYFDHDSSGKYNSTYEEEINRPNPRVNPMIGVERLKKFVEICERNNVRCFIGEFGAPAGDGVDPRWLVALENALKYMHEHRISSTYWAAGDHWTRRGTSYVIGKNGWKAGEHVGEERPQTTILKKYIKLAEEANKPGGSSAAPAPAPTATVPVKASKPESGEPRRNLLFFGNSFTSINRVPALVGLVAKADGHPRPFIVTDLAGGTDIDRHIRRVASHPERNVTYPRLPAGTTWDAVIIQGYSTEATRLRPKEDNPFEEDVLALFEAVREHPSGKGKDATAVLYQTWSRPDLVPHRFKTLESMMKEIAAGYRKAGVLIKTRAGVDARIAEVGKTFEAAGSPASLFATDRYHAGKTGSLLAALVLYRAIYGETVSDIPYSKVSRWSGVSEADWKRFVSLADGD